LERDRDLDEYEERDDLERYLRGERDLERDFEDRDRDGDLEGDRDDLEGDLDGDRSFGFSYFFSNEDKLAKLTET